MSPVELTQNGSETASLFDVENENETARQDRHMVVELLRRQDRVDLALPVSIDSLVLWRTLDVCAHFFVRIAAAKHMLKLMVGRALIVIQQRPEFFTSRGYDNFSDFMSDTVRGLPRITGISRAELFKAKAVAAQLGPTITLEDARDVGLTKLQLIAGVTDSGSAEQRELVEAARTDTMVQLRERIVRNGLVGSTEDLEWDALIFTLTKTQKTFVQEFLDNPLVQAYCKTSSPGIILEMMVAELSEEWQVRETLMEAEVRDQ